MMVGSLKAQDSYIGVSNSGVILGNFEKPLLDLGLSVEQRADSGIYLSGTNVTMWANTLGNNAYNAYQYTPTNQPTFVTYGTNVLGNSVKCVAFTQNFLGIPGGNTHLIQDGAGAIFSGNRTPFMYIQIANSFSNGNSIASWSCGNNTNSTSRMLFLPSQSANTSAMDYGIVTGGGLTVGCSVSGGTTNRWFIYTTICNGTNWQTFRNLSPGSVGSPSNMDIGRPLDLMALGYLRSSANLNGSGASRYWGFIAGQWMFITNATQTTFTGTDVTNAVRFINTNMVYGFKDF